MKAKQRLENTQKLSRSQRAGREPRSRIEQERGCRASKELGKGGPGNPEFSVDISQGHWKQCPLSGIIAIGPRVKINFVQGSE